MNLPKNEKSFLFNKKGELTGHTYEGQFTTKCVLSLADKRILELEQNRLMGDLENPTENLRVISRVVANLRVRVIDAPDWFNQLIINLDILDEDIVFDLYAECLKCSNDWHDELKGKAETKQEIVEGNSPAES